MTNRSWDWPDGLLPPHLSVGHHRRLWPHSCAPRHWAAAELAGELARAHLLAFAVYVAATRAKRCPPSRRKSCN